MKNILLIEKETIICLDLKRTFKSCFPESNITVVNDTTKFETGFYGADLVVLDCHSFKQSNFNAIIKMLGNALANAVPVILCHSGNTADKNFDYLNIIGDFQKPFSAQKLVDLYKVYSNRFENCVLNNVA